MFQFTTTNVINSNKDLTSGKDLWTVVEANDEKGTPASLNVKRVMNFKQPNVVSITKTDPVDGIAPVVNIDFSKITASEGDRLRLFIYVRLTEGSNFSLYANDFYYKGKPFSIDFTWKGEAKDVVAALEKNIKKYLVAVHGEKIANVKADGTSLVITGVSEYQRFAKVAVEKLDADAHFGMGEYVEVLGNDDLTEVDKPTVSANQIFKGTEGFGTYSWILHNLRLPTDARTAPWAVNSDEAPIPGAKYTQFTIHYCVNRGTLGTNAVGDQVVSHTTHVFYVHESLVSEFEKALETIQPDDVVTAGSSDEP
jgi:hypothetical protein